MPLRGRNPLEARLRDPYFCPVDFDFEEEAVVFAALRAKSLLGTLRLTAFDFPLRRLVSVPLATVSKALAEQPAYRSINYLFHLPFCGSTLLTRFVERAAFVIRDPVTLSALYQEDPHRSRSPRTLCAFRRATLRLLSRPPGDRAIVIRTAGYYPEMMAPLASSRTCRSALYLYADLPFFVSQVLKCAVRRRQLRTLFSDRASYASLKTGVTLARLPDAGIAALAWLYSVEQFVSLAQRLVKHRIRTLDWKDLFQRGPRSAVNVCRFWDIPDLQLTDSAIERIRSRHSKTKQPFRRSSLLSEVGEFEKTHRREMAIAERIVRRADPNGRLAAELRRLALNRI